MDGRGTRVLFVDCAPFSGGAQRSLLAMVKRLHVEGIAPLVVSADDSVGGLLEGCTNAGIPTVPISSRHWSCSPAGLLQYLLDRRRVVPQLAALIRDWTPQIVHANTLRAALLLPPKALAGIPMVVHDRDVRAPALARRIVAGRAEMILAISRIVASQWDAAGPDQVELVPNGLDIDEIARAIPDESCANAVLMVADFVPWKRHDLFLAAFARIHARRPDARAVLVGRARCGESSWLRKVRTLVGKHGLGEAVTIRTDVTDACPCIADCRMLVSCAKREPFGRTVVEALALGRPVVAVGGGGPDDVLLECDAGILVTDNAEALAQAMLTAWDWRLDQRRTEAARERAARFSVERLVQRVHEVYRGVLGTSGE